MKQKIKDKSRKHIVDEYIKMVQDSIERIKTINHKMSKDMKRYVDGLEKSIVNAPYLLGYLEKNIKK